MVVETQAVSQLFSKTVYNQFCFLQFEQAMEQSIKLPPEEWKEVAMYIFYVCMYVCHTYIHTYVCVCVCVCVCVLCVLCVCVCLYV